MRAHIIIGSLIRPVYEFLFPQVCLTCNARLQHDEQRICAGCWGNIKPLAEDDPNYLELRERIWAGGFVNTLVSAYLFEKGSPLQTIIHHLKYEGITALGVEMGRRLGKVILPFVRDEQFDGLVPVPLHPTKERERGYNQSEYICKGIQEVTGLTVFPKLLWRQKHTRSQTQLSFEERKENVRNAFRLGTSYKAFVRGRSLLLVDDVITTGATIDSCAQVLREHGARVVSVVSVAVASRSDLP